MSIPFTLGLWVLTTYTTHVLSIVTGNDSWVDRAWSIAPAIYVASLTRWDDPRSVVVAAAVTLWAARLTFNFWRKDGYNPRSEDHRWAYIRSILPGPLYTAFHLLFISIYQNLLLLLIALPAAPPPLPLPPRASGPQPWCMADTAILIVFSILLALETLADEQQWAYHQLKQATTTSTTTTSSPEHRRQIALGFCTTGVYRYSRHMNFFAEMGIWWCVYAWGVVARQNHHWINPTLVGPLLLTLLFQGSTAFTESISAKKYPAYKIYQQTTSRLIPLWPGPPINSHINLPAPRKQQ
ncbi:hypothetical protein DFJ77DRAFT_202455 [Powellomyces hirtus]|nr:hypothetical protein DFJ77DRAFT_202455 [Powellomyces hirtus]